MRLPRRIIACCPEAAKMASTILRARPELSLRSGWGETSLHRFRGEGGTLIAQIPHLSTFKLLSRSECIEPLRSILDLR